MSTRTRSLTLFGLLVLLTACGPEFVDPPTQQDSGNPDVELDAGEEPEDPGTEPPDAGSPEEDAGTPAEDAGTPVRDAGTTVRDAGTTVRDAGTTVRDAGTTVKDAGPPAPEPPFIQVYVNNIENLMTPSDQCPGDWQDLFFYMKSITPSPDLFLLQQVTDLAQLNRIVQHMNTTLVGNFAGVIAEANPAAFNSPCGAVKDKQTNAIIYRIGRFEPVGSKHTWQSWRNFSGECRRDNLARTVNVMQKFRDKLGNGRMVTVASIHWSTSQETGADPACARKNAAEVDQKLRMSGFGGELLIFGGDLNEPDRKTDTASSDYRPWFEDLNGDLGGPLNFRDVIYSACKQATNLKACLVDNWTGNSRIDFLFAKRGSGGMPPVSAAVTIPYAEADAAALRFDGTDSPANYSQHRGLRARIRY